MWIVAKMKKNQISILKVIKNKIGPETEVYVLKFKFLK